MFSFTLLLEIQETYDQWGKLMFLTIVLILLAVIAVFALYSEKKHRINKIRAIKGYGSGCGSS